MPNKPKQEEPTLGKKIGEIASVAIVNMISDNRWYQNWKSTDNKDQWTKDDFHLLKFPEDIGSLGGAAVDFVVEVKPQIQALINSQVLQAIEKIKSNLDDLPHVNYKGGYQIPYEEIEGMIEAIEKEYRNE